MRCSILARPRKNTGALQGEYTKEEMQKRLELENRLQGKSDRLSAPDFIKDDIVALGKFNQLVEDLSSCDLLTNVDVDLLVAYSECWSKYVKSTKILSVQDLVEEQEIKQGVISKIANPYLKIQQSYLDRLVKLSSLFGLSPADRSKIAHLQPSDKNTKVDPLMELLSGLKK